MDNLVESSIYSCLLNIYNRFSVDSTGGFDRILERLKTYYELIKHWTCRENLVSAADVDNLWIKHIVPSLHPLRLELIPPSASCLDAGSGAGFPGLPIKLFRGDISLDLCESRRKRALFLKEAVRTLKLENTRVLHQRLEEVEERYDIVLSRAMGKPGEVYRLLLERLKPGGTALLWTAKSAPENFPECEVQSYDIPQAGKLLSLKKVI